MRKNKIGAAVFSMIVVFSGFLFADEGMWLLNNLPLKQLKDKYNFVPTPEWVGYVQKSSARLPNCSTSFVSADGLLVTNWHCPEEAVKALSTPKHNYYEKGFYARTLSEELKTNLNIRVLMSMTDVTQIVNDAVANDKNIDSVKTRQEAISQIQKNRVGLSTADMLSVGSNFLNQNSFVCEVVILYQGGRYHNYCYKVFNDVRLVFMPEQRVGFFGGDADNFEYPRYTLDVSFLRAYENDKPVSTSCYFRWSKSGDKEGELIFAAGHPGRTARMLTSTALATERDVRVPFLLDLFRRRELTTQQFIIRSRKNKQIAESDLFSWQNSRKLYVGKIRGLQDPKLLNKKENFEREVVNNADSVDRLEFVYGLLMVKEAQETIRKIYPGVMLVGRGFGFDSRLFNYAKSIVSGNNMQARAVLNARSKEAPLNLEYEEAKLRDSLVHLFEVLGAQNIIPVAGGPASMAHDLVYGTKLVDPNVHAELVSGNFNLSDDPMIMFARKLESASNTYLKEWNNALEKERQGYSKISSILFKLYGTDMYPDATFTLRLAFGTVLGYEEDGRIMPPWTTVGGAYKHALAFGNAGDHKLPSRWWNRKRFVNLKTPLNFVSDIDITGGNSGSPVFNRNLEIVGLVFDSNIHGLVSDYDYNYSPQARAIAVSSAGIIEILSKIYRADRLVAELTR